MTVHEPSNGSKLITKWIAPILIGVASFGITSFFTDIVEQRTQNVRIASLENGYTKLATEQEETGKYIQHMHDFETQYNKDMASMLSGQQEIKDLLTKHDKRRQDVIVLHPVPEKK